MYVCKCLLHTSLIIPQPFTCGQTLRSFPHSTNYTIMDTDVQVALHGTDFNALSRYLEERWLHHTFVLFLIFCVMTSPIHSPTSIHTLTNICYLLPLKVCFIHLKSNWREIDLLFVSPLSKCVIVRAALGLSPELGTQPGTSL